jgi:hypothetical protein
MRNEVNREETSQGLAWRVRAGQIFELFHSAGSHEQRGNPVMRRRRILATCSAVLAVSGAAAQMSMASGQPLVLRYRGSGGEALVPGERLTVVVQLHMNGLRCTQAEEGTLSANGAAKEKLALTGGLAPECDSLISLSGRLANAELTGEGAFSATSKTLTLTRTYFVVGHPSYSCAYLVKKLVGSFPLPGFVSMTTSRTTKLKRGESSRSCPRTEIVEASMWLDSVEFEPIWGET